MSRNLYAAWSEFQLATNNLYVKSFETHVPIRDESLYFVGPGPLRPAGVPANAAYMLKRKGTSEIITALYTFPYDSYNTLVYGLNGRTHSLESDHGTFNRFGLYAHHSAGDLGDHVVAFAIGEAEENKARPVLQIDPDVTGMIAAAIDEVIAIKVQNMCR